MYYRPCKVNIILTEEENVTMKKETLKIQGMTCNHCVVRVAKALKAVPGVKIGRAHV